MMAVSIKDDSGFGNSLIIESIKSEILNISCPKAAGRRGLFAGKEVAEFYLYFYVREKRERLNVVNNLI